MEFFDFPFGAMQANLTPADLEFELVHERRFELDGTIPLDKEAFWPGAQYVARVTALPAAVKFVTTDGEEKLRYEVRADDARLPAVPFDLAVMVTGRVNPAVFARKDGKVRMLDLVTLPGDFDPRETKYAKTLRFRGEGGAEAAEVALTAGIGQADIRFVTEGRENSPYVEGGRLFFTFSARGYGSFLGVMSIDPDNPSDLACYVCSYPELNTIGKLKFDIPPWPTDKTGWPHGRIWPAVVELPDGCCLMVTMDRANYPGMPQPNWTYGKLMVYMACPMKEKPLLNNNCFIKQDCRI